MVMEDVERFFNILMDLRKSGKTSYGGVPVDECRRMIQKGLEDPKVKLLLEEMEKSGCSINPKKWMLPAHCHSRHAASFSPRGGIYVCCNYVSFQDDVTQALTHELIHAYDHCRAKNIDWSNCYHQACSEIRANALSGDCHYLRELLRGQKKLKGHEPECVRRRASQSVRSNPKCTEYMTNKAMESVWETCYNDRKPLDKT